MERGQTALLTGASGFIGRRLRSALLEMGLDVVAIRRSASPEADEGRTVVADYQDPNSVRAAIADERPHYVFHIAGVTKGVTLADFRKGNVVPTRHLLDALEAIEAPVERFVHVSSLAAFGPSTPEQPHTEDAPRRPVEHYGQSKLEAEIEVESRKIPFTILRPGGVYGPGDVDYFQLFKTIESGRNVFFGNRKRFTSMVFVDDVVRAVVDAARTPAAANRGYFICDGNPISWEDLQQKIVEASGRNVKTIDLPEFLVSLAAFGGEMLTRVDRKPRLFNRQKAKMGQQPAWTCTHASARRDFDYSPQFPLDTGLPQTIAWYRKNGWM